jgi:hypothetical protein
VFEQLAVAWRNATPVREQKRQEKQSSGYGRKIALRNYGMIVLLIALAPVVWWGRGWLKEDAERKQAELFGAGFSVGASTPVVVGLPAATPSPVSVAAPVASPVPTLNPAWPWSGYGWMRATQTAVAALPTPEQYHYAPTPGAP